MKRNLIITRDGSHSVAIDGKDIFYHSIHGAIQESTHIFIEAGYNYFIQKHKPASVSILEIGMGTGLNLLLTIAQQDQQSPSVNYTAIEPFPLSTEQAASLNFCDILHRNDLCLTLAAIHESPWSQHHQLTGNVSLYKIREELHETVLSNEAFDIIYFDVFAPSYQPELWDEATFKQLYNSLRPGGILLTYCSKTIVRKAMMAAGFAVTKIQGPFGKREMVRAKRD